VKASTGTVFSTPVVRASGRETAAWLRDNRVRVIAADPAASRSYRDADYRGPLAIVLGSERRGVSAWWRSLADDLVSIPMLGLADSLNVGHAAALLAYESMRAAADGAHGDPYAAGRCRSPSSTTRS
jgi:TrmH family RNA methyltransferase